MKKLLALFLLFGIPAQAEVICAGCEYGQSAGSFLGSFNALTHDLATFTHTGVGSDRMFEDFWVFDVSPDALASTSADFTTLAPILSFFGELYQDAGSVCEGFDCSSIAVGDLLAQASGGSRFEIIDFLSAGRYVLRIGGIPNPINEGAYSGQIAFFGATIGEAGTLGLFGLGLLALGMVVRRHQR